MILTLLLAWRNLWRHRRRTWLTVGAMIFINLLMVFVISLQLGSYDLMISTTVKQFSGYAQVLRPGYFESPKINLTIPDIETLGDTIRQAMPQYAVSVRASGSALVSSETRTFGAGIVGVQPATEPGVSVIPGKITEGRFLDDPEAAEIVIGRVLARNLKTGVGEELTLLGSGKDGSFAAGVVTVVGIFEAANPEFERTFAEVPLHYFQDVFSMGQDGHNIVMAVDKPDFTANAVAIARQVLQSSGDEAIQSLEVLDWDALNPGLQESIYSDFLGAWFIWFVLIILVAFSVMNTQLMSVLERTHEFGVIMSLGIKPRRLVLLILLETLLMAALGLILGMALGAATTSYFVNSGILIPGIEDIGGAFGLVDRIYPAISLLSLTLGPGCVFLFSLVAALYPALRLLRLKPVDAMRAV